MLGPELGAVGNGKAQFLPRNELSMLETLTKSIAMFCLSWVVHFLGTWEEFDKSLLK